MLTNSHPSNAQSVQVIVSNTENVPAVQLLSSTTIPKPQAVRQGEDDNFRADIQLGVFVDRQGIYVY